LVGESLALLLSVYEVVGGTGGVYFPLGDDEAGEAVREFVEPALNSRQSYL
jgi:hypothetical protein